MSQPQPTMPDPTPSNPFPVPWEQGPTITSSVDTWGRLIIDGEIVCAHCLEGMGYCPGHPMEMGLTLAEAMTAPVIRIGGRA